VTHPHFPVWDVRVRTPRIELRAVTQQEMADQAEVAQRGIFSPGAMPMFSEPWTDLASPELERTMYQYWFRKWSEWSVDEWCLPFAVYLLDDGTSGGSGATCVGNQITMASHFLTTRVVSTGSWLGLEHQGQGIGKEVRAAALHLAFEGLGAVRAESEALADNIASQKVTLAMGYHPNGDTIVVQRDVAQTLLRFALDRSDWESQRRDDITIEGLDGALDMFGLA